jgi:L-serine dehydratase
VRPPSVLDVLKPAVGPSSSHTFGPLLAAREFAGAVRARDTAGGRIRVVLYGSLAHTGRGHLTPAAVAAGLAGYGIDDLRAHPLREVYAGLSQSGGIPVGCARFDPTRDVVFDTETEVPHPNTIRFELLSRAGHPVLSTVYLSVGGGRLVGGSFPHLTDPDDGESVSTGRVIEACEQSGATLPEYVLDVEAGAFGHPRRNVMAHAESVWGVMQATMDAGLQREGVLPGPLGVNRRAAALLRRHRATAGSAGMLFPDTTLASIYAIAVAEENADGGIVVAAPTCGSSGVLPACLRIVQERRGVTDARICEALLVAGLIGAAAVSRASIAGAVVGCQGEIGVASAMAAAAACYLLGGSVQDQVDRAAETALEHFLGLACDPVGGLVQIPCIERNAAGVVSALNAASLALLSGGRDRVSLDATLDAMREIGRDMPDKYRETALGGLAAVPDLDGDGIPDGRER